MEGVHGMHLPEKSLYPDKIRRTVKTPAQVEALERFYNEHNYPNESMKLQLAMQIGLSEKQVSVWLCHRRSKDKRLMQSEVCVRSKQNISSGHASGFGQESCSSTKQMDKHFDPREVESKRSCDHNSSSIVLALEHGGQQTNSRQCNSPDDDTSGSSSTSHDRPMQCNENNRFMEHSRFAPINDSYKFRNAGNVNKRNDMFDPRYSCFDVPNERALISCIKRKLGGQYRTDGPPLGVGFDPLPPGAFDSLLEDSKTEHYLVGNFVNRNFCGIPASSGKLKVYDNNRSGILSSGLFEEDQPLKRRRKGFSSQSDLPNCELNQKSKMLHKTVENAANEMPVYNDWRSQRCFTQSSKVGAKRNLLMSGQKPDTNMLCHNHSQNNYGSVVSRGEVMRGVKLLSQEHERSYFLDVNDTMLCRQPMKKKKISKERITRNDSCSLRPKITRTNEMKFAGKTKKGRILMSRDGQEHSK